MKLTMLNNKLFFYLIFFTNVLIYVHSEHMTVDVKMGVKTAHGDSNYRYQTGFPFNINGEQYFYQQTIKDSNKWYIQRLTKDGTMGRITTVGCWENNYEITFPFNINNRQYFYGLNTATKHWFIKEILENGQMGIETDTGIESRGFKTVFPYKIKNREFFLGHNPDSKRWFIQELLPNGKLGNIIDDGSWDNGYETAFHFDIGDRHYMYAQNLGTKYWFIQELLPNGKLGNETSNGFSPNKYEVGVPFKLCDRAFFYSHSITDKYKWFIQELLPGGIIGRETAHDVWSHGYEVSFSYAVDDQVFLVAFGRNHYNWFIQEMQFDSNGTRQCRRPTETQQCFLCKDLTLYDLKAFFNGYLVDYGANSVEYCEMKKRGIDDVVANTFGALDDIIAYRRQSNNVRVISGIWDPFENPVLEYGEAQLLGGINMASYLIARIESPHLRTSEERPPIPNSVRTHLRDNMGLIQGDEAGHILAHQLGGWTNETFNFIPMTRLLNRGTGSIWRLFENSIPNFLNREPQGHVDWRLAVIYDPTPTNPQNLRRPIGVCVQYSETDDNGNVEPIDEICLSNDPTDTTCTPAWNPWNP